MDTRKMTLNQDRTRKLADRTPMIVARNAGIPEVATIGAMVVPYAAAYVATHEALKLQRAETRRALQTGRAEVAALHARQRLWRGTLVRDLLGFERTDANAPVSDPDGVLADAKHLVALVRKDGGDLPYAAMLVNDVTTLSERAGQAWAAAQTELKKQQLLQGELRSNAAHFLSGLVRLRVALRETLGSHDRDYRALRANTRNEDPDVVELDALQDPDPAAKKDGKG